MSPGFWMGFTVCILVADMVRRNRPAKKGGSK